MVVTGTAPSVLDDMLVVACRHNLRPQAAIVQLVEDRAAHQLAAAVGMHQVEQPRRQLSTIRN